MSLEENEERRKRSRMKGEKKEGEKIYERQKK